MRAFCRCTDGRAGCWIKDARMHHYESAPGLRAMRSAIGTERVSLQAHGRPTARPFWKVDVCPAAQNGESLRAAPRSCPLAQFQPTLTARVRSLALVEQQAACLWRLVEIDIIVATGESR